MSTTAERLEQAKQQHDRRVNELSDDPLLHELKGYIQALEELNADAEETTTTPHKNGQVSQGTPSREASHATDYKD